MGALVFYIEVMFLGKTGDTGETFVPPSKRFWSHLYVIWGLSDQCLNGQGTIDMSLNSFIPSLHNLEKNMPLLHSTPQPPHLPLLSPHMKVRSRAYEYLFLVNVMVFHITE